MITAEEFIGVIQKEEGSPFKLGVVHSLGSTGVKVLFDGEEKASGKEYLVLGSCSPFVGDRVLLANVSGTWLVLGTVGTPVGEFKINGAFQHAGGNVAFFGKTPFRQRTLSALSSNASTAEIITQVNWLRTFLRDFGFIQ